VSHTVFSFLSGAFNERVVTAQVLLTALFYVEKSRGLPASGADDDLLKRLEAEEFSPETTDLLKQYLISFAATTQDGELFASCIGVLQAFHDPKLHPLLTGWLDGHLRALLRYSGNVHSLIHALERTGASIPHRQSGGVTSVESNIETARDYLGVTLGTHYPW
jgi:hypothetical protein